MRFRRSTQTLAIRQAIGVMGITILATGPVQADNGDENADDLEPVVVSATRVDTPVSELSRSVTVIEEREIEQQARLDNNLSTILGKTVPGFGGSTQAVSNYGQSIRGRNFLVMIDGIPQSTPLNEGFRDLNTIAPSSIERIEVVRGGTATYGFGAAGGLVNVITKKASDKPVAGYSRFGASFNTEETDDSGIYETEQRVSGTSDDFDYVLSGSLTDRNGFFDSEGRRIPPNPNGAQGGFSDTDQGSLLAKAGYDFGGDQRFQFMLNHYQFEQDSNYTYGAFIPDANGDPASGSTLRSDPLPNSKRTPAIKVSEALSGSAAEFQPQTENTTSSLTYTNDDYLGSSVRVNTFYGDQSVIFPKYPGFPQGETVSEKFGSRLTVNTPIENLAPGAEVSWGADYLADETDAERLGSSADYVPNLDQDAFAAFGQLEMPIGDAGLLRSGLRHEVIEVDTTGLESNINGHEVTGGTLEYDETLFNLSGVLFLSDSLELFGGYSEGFSLASLGRVIRDAGPIPGTAGYSRQTFDVEQFEEDAEKVDNYELGIRSITSNLNASLTAFYSESDNGTTFETAGGNPSIVKSSEEIYGVEASVDYRINAATRVGGTLSYSEGEREDEDGSTYELTNIRISPEKLTAYVEHSPSTRWNTRLQLFALGGRDPDTDPLASGQGDVDGYELVDLVSSYRVGPGTLEVSLSNLLNEDYYPAVNQALDNPTTYAKGPGRRLGVSYAMNW